MVGSRYIVWLIVFFWLQITWLDGNQSVVKKNVKVKIEDLPDGQRFKTR